MKIFFYHISGFYFMSNPFATTYNSDPSLFVEELVQDAISNFK